MAISSRAPAIFLDRDGTLNIEKGYLHQWADWEWLPGASDALAALKQNGFKLIVVTNQAGVARGYYDETAVAALHCQVNRDLKRRGAAIDAFYYCPHHPDISGACACRKPAPGMLTAAAADLYVDLAGSYMIGDKILDMEAGLAAGCRCILVRTGYGRGLERRIPAGVTVVDDLSAATELILRTK